MSSANSLTFIEKRLLRRTTVFLALALFILISLYIFVFAPLYVFYASDVLYMGTMLPEVFSVLGTLTDVLVFGTVYGTVLYALYRFSLRRSVRLFVIYGIAVLYKNAGHLLMTYLTDGVPTAPLSDILSILLYLGLELVQSAIVILIGAVILFRFRKREEIRKDAARIVRKDYAPIEEAFPIKKLLSFRNPIQRASFWMAFVPMTVKILQRLIYDVWFTLMYGFYDGYVDILWMILYYALDVICFGVIVYLVMILLATQLHDSERKIKEKDSASEDTLFS